LTIPDIPNCIDLISFVLLTTRLIWKRYRNWIQVKPVSFWHLHRKCSTRGTENTIIRTLSLVVRRPNLKCWSQFVKKFTKRHHLVWWKICLT